MKRGLLLGICALGASYRIHRLLTPTGTLTATNLLEISALLCLTVTFLWYSLSYILLYIGEKRRNVGLLTFITHFGSPRARQLATIALLLAPTAACTSPNIGNNDIGMPVAITQTVTTKAASNHETPSQTIQAPRKSQYRTPEHLQRQHLEPAILRRMNNTVLVTHGDCLWSIAQRLHPTFSPPQLTEFVQQLYHQNANQITNPDVIHPGQILELPTTER